MNSGEILAELFACAQRYADYDDYLYLNLQRDVIRLADAYAFSIVTQSVPAENDITELSSEGFYRDPEMWKAIHHENTLREGSNLAREATLSNARELTNQPLKQNEN